MNARRRKPGAGPSPEPPSLTRRLRAWLPDPPADAATLDNRTTFVLVLATLLLVVFQYFGKPESYRGGVGSSRVDLQACKLEYSIVSPK